MRSSLAARTVWAGPAAAGLMMLGLACAGPSSETAPAPEATLPISPPEASAPAQLSVSVVRGLDAPMSHAAAPVHAVVDLGSSRVGRASPRAAVRAAADRYLRALPPGRDVRLQVLGQGHSGCVAPHSPQAARNGPASADAVAAMRGGARGSISDALGQIEARAGEGELIGASIVVWSDFGARCPGDPCATAERLVEAGASFDLVAFGAGEPPVCLSRLAHHVPSDRLAAAQVLPPSTADVAYRVERPAASPELVARGLADGSSTELSAGRARVVVELEPEMRVGPLPLEAGTHTRVRILDFPGAGVRQFFVDRVPVTSGAPETSAVAPGAAPPGRAEAPPATSGPR